MNRYQNKHLERLKAISALLTQAGAQVRHLKRSIADSERKKSLTRERRRRAGLPEQWQP
jgi:hypothetical protein